VNKQQLPNNSKLHLASCLFSSRTIIAVPAAWAQTKTSWSSWCNELA